jgi:hypothetical protein
MPTVYRQGDVLLVKVSFLPDDRQPLAPENDHHILANGEVTGHAHRILMRQAEMYSSGGGPYLYVPEAAQLLHEEHGIIEIPAGNYRVVRQREYTPEAIRQVTD